METTTATIGAMIGIFLLWAIAMVIVAIVTEMGMTMNIDYTSMNINELKHLCKTNNIGLERKSYKKNELIGLIKNHNNNTVERTVKTANNRLDDIRKSHFRNNNGIIFFDNDLVFLGFKVIQSILQTNYVLERSKIQQLNVKPGLYRMKLEPVECMDWKAFNELKMASLNVEKPLVEKLSSGKDIDISPDEMAMLLKLKKLLSGL